MGSNNDISLKALAKINLGLDVVRRREDGYHEVRMIMQTIHLYDRLDIKKDKGAWHTDTDQSVFSPCKREQSHIQGCKASDG